MATCGHCKQAGQTVAHVRTCGQAGTVATAERHLPELNPGNVVTLTLEDGYWLVEANLAGDEFQAAKVQARGRTCASFHVRQVEMVFPNLNSAAEYRIAEAAQERQAYETNESPWAPVQRLREQIKLHLNRETARGKVRHFAYRADGKVKFYRVKETTQGRVYVDAIAGGSQRDHDGVAYPVKTPASLTEVLQTILVDPDAAATLYGQELTRCSDCNRTLTDETSRALGIGPECRSK